MELPQLSHILFQGAIFIFCFTVLSRFVFNPILAILREREARMQGDREEAKKLVEDAEVQIKRYEDQLYQAKSEAKEMKLKILQEASRQEREILTQAREESSKLIRKTRERLRQEAHELLPQLKKQSEILARDMAQIILGRNVG